MNSLTHYKFIVQETLALSSRKSTPKPIYLSYLSTSLRSPAKRQQILLQLDQNVSLFDGPICILFNPSSSATNMESYGHLHLRLHGHLHLHHHDFAKLEQRYNYQGSPSSHQHHFHSYDGL
jgi:hypothetical protein